VHHVTVAICTHNNAASLDRTLATLALQEFAGDYWSALVVDNKSSDATEEIVRLHQQRGLIPHLRYCRESQLGLAHARHRAVKETTSELIAFVDDDCLLTPDWLRQAVAFSRTHPNAGAIGGRVELLWESPPPAIALSRRTWYAEQIYGDTPQQMPSTGFAYLVGAGLVLRRIALEESGWLETRLLVGREGRGLGSGEDIEIVLRIRRAGYDLWYNPAMTLEHVPERRTSVQYLCRLNRATDRPLPMLHALAEGKAPSTGVRLRRLIRSLLSLAKLCVRTLVVDVAVKRRISFVEWRIRMNLAWSRVVGAATFLFAHVEL
jgi:GT2 family glycosyltransferase